jgi:hypothetical protein
MKEQQKRYQEEVDRRNNIIRQKCLKAILCTNFSVNMSRHNRDTLSEMVDIETFGSFISLFGSISDGYLVTDRVVHLLRAPFHFQGNGVTF